MRHSNRLLNVLWLANIMDIMLNAFSTTNMLFGDCCSRLGRSRKGGETMRSHKTLSTYSHVNTAKHVFDRVTIPPCCV